MKKYKNKYRIPSARHPNWDYGNNAAYFVTICTQNRKCFFGKVTNAQMELSEIGALANQYWKQIPGQFPYAVLHDHIVMPNHIHGIIEIAKIDDDNVNGFDRGSDGGSDGGSGRDAINRVSTITEKTPIPNNPSPQNNNFGGFAKTKNPMINENLSRIIRWYKGVVTFHSHRIHADFAWQPRFHDHIIRNQQSFDRIKSYIVNNPINWTDDKFFKK